MYRIFKKNGFLFSLVLIFTCTFSFAEVGKAYLMGELLNSTLDFTEITHLIQFTLIFFLIYILLSTFKDYFIVCLENRIRYRLNKERLEDLMKMSPEWVANRDSSTFIQNMTNKTDQIIDSFVHSWLLIIELFFSFLLGNLFIGFFSWIMLVFLYLGLLIPQ